MKPINNSAQLGKSKIDKLAKFLVDIINKYAVICTVKKSKTASSDSKYILFSIKNKTYTIRISDHTLPNYHKRYRKDSFDLRPYQYKEGKYIIIGLFAENKIKKIQTKQWGINIRNIVDEYTDALAKQENPIQYKQWTTFLFTLTALTSNQKQKLFQVPFSEIMQRFKLPQEIPEWIDCILRKYS